MVKKLVRLALASEYQRRPIRRGDITEKVLGSQGRRFKKVFDQAQLDLQSVFGMEMVELPAKEKVTIRQRRGELLLFGYKWMSWQTANDQQRPHNKTSQVRPPHRGCSLRFYPPISTTLRSCLLRLCPQRVKRAHTLASIRSLSPRYP